MQSAGLSLLRQAEFPEKSPLGLKRPLSLSSNRLPVCWLASTVQRLLHPHVAPDRCIHGLAGAPTSIMRGAPPRRVCPPVAIILVAAHSFSLLPRSSGAWGISPPGVLAGHFMQVRPSLSGQNRAWRCKMQSLWSLGSWLTRLLTLGSNRWVGVIHCRLCRWYLTSLTLVLVRTVAGRYR